MDDAAGDSAQDPEGRRVRAVVERVAAALDADDFATVESLLHDDVLYLIDGRIHRGPGAVVASYGAGSQLARRLFDEVRFGHEIVAAVSPGTLRVDFVDHLRIAGDAFTHHSIQDIEVSADGLIVRITDRPVAGERARLDAFMARHDLTRPPVDDGAAPGPGPD